MEQSKQDHCGKHLEEIWLTTLAFDHLDLAYLEEGGEDVRVTGDEQGKGGECTETSVEHSRPHGDQGVMSSI